MPNKETVKLFVDHQLELLVQAIRREIERHYSFKNESDFRDYVVFDLLGRLGYAEQSISRDRDPGWVMTKHGRAMLYNLKATEDKYNDDEDDEEED